MRDALLQLEGGLLVGCMFALGAIVLGVVFVEVVRGWKIWRVKRKKLALALLALVAVIVGGTKSRVIVDDPYVRDSGSFVTNDFVHVAIVARYDFIPASMEVMIWSRELSLTNAEDWVRIVRAEEGPFRLAEFPIDIPFPDATNYEFMVAANYVPEPTVHTNGVWQIKGFIVPGTPGGETTGMMAFPNTKTKEIP